MKGNGTECEKINRLMQEWDRGSGIIKRGREYVWKAGRDVTNEGWKIKGIKKKYRGKWKRMKDRGKEISQKGIRDYKMAKGNK